jgi:hypothetical protein
MDGVISSRIGSFMRRCGFAQLSDMVELDCPRLSCGGSIVNHVLVPTALSLSVSLLDVE